MHGRRDSHQPASVPDHEQFERRQLAHDQDTRAAGLDERLTDQRAQQIVKDLEAEGAATIHYAEQFFTHRPSGEAFETARGLVLFHRGWEAAIEEDKRDSD